MIIDNHNRPINYLRLAVTDRCNLRCFYCMPQEGIAYLPKKELLSFEEIERLVRLLARQGISKVRITGGEPFVRTDLMKLLYTLSGLQGVAELHITTNGVLTAPHVEELKRLGIASVNLSLDTLDRERFKTITRRDELPRVMETLDLLLANDIPTKVNAVVMEGKNIADIVLLAELARRQPVSVRFIEEMPFNGEGNHYENLAWTYQRIVEYLRQHYPNMQREKDPAHSTAYHYRVPGFKGDIGVIAAFSRTFCGTCNRIRITAQGHLKTCLYDDGVLDIKTLLRSGVGDDELLQQLQSAFQSRNKDGFESERKRTNNPVHESMSTIGG